MRDIKKIRELVGDVTEEDLKYVECYVSKNIGIFIPSVGFCKYAITPSHTHPSYSFVIFHSKEQNFIDSNIEVPNGHYLAYMIKPDAPHEEKVSDHFVRYIAICIDKDYFENIYQKYIPEPPNFNNEWNQFFIKHEVMTYIKKFMAEYQERIIGYKDILDALSEIICHALVREIIGAKNEKSFSSDNFEIENVIEYMHQHFDNKITVEDLAKKTNMSKSHFIRVFKKVTGLSPMDYLINIRIEKAKKLLTAGNKNISEISLLCGFNSISHFSSTFSKHVGISPSKYYNMYSKN